MMKNISNNILSSLSEQEACVYTHHFFDLTAGAFASFLKGKPVWQPIHELKEFFSTLTLGQINVEIPKGVHLEHPELISIGEGTVIEPGATLIGPCVLGKNCSVRQGAYVRGYVLTDDHVVIGHATETKGSIFLKGAKAAHFAYVGNSIVGRNVNLGAGTKCANLRFDHKPIVIRSHDHMWETGMKKLGAILGDGAQTGCNSVTSPGTLVDKMGVIAPCCHVKGWIR